MLLGDKMSHAGRYQDADYTSKLHGLDGWTRGLVDAGKFACRDAAIDCLVKDYEKRFLRNASPTERFVLDAVATGLRLYMPECEMVQLVTQGMSPFLPRKWANRKASKAMNMALNGLGVCSNIRLFGLDETVRAWGNDAKPRRTVGGFAKSVLSSLYKTATAMAGSAMYRHRRTHSYNVGPVTVSAHVRHLKNGRTVQVRFHRRRRTDRR